MPYVSDLPDDLALTINTLENSSEAIARVPIGRDLTTGTQYSIFVALISLVDEDFGEGAMEIIFEVVAIDAGNPIYHLDGRETKTFLIGRERTKVLDAICQCVHLLVKLREPPLVHMGTSSGPTPKKALTKYNAVSRAIRDAGYTGGPADRYDELDIWMFIKDDC